MAHGRWTLALAAGLLLAFCGATQAGTISLAWDPVDHPDLAGYRVYYDTVSGAFGQSVDVDSSTSATLSGLADCTPYQVAVKAYDGTGVESSTFSGTVTGWARPIVTSVLPGVLEQHSQATLTINGTNFMQGAVVSTDDAGVTVEAVGWASCQRLVVDVSVGAASLGPVAIRVVNPDGVFGDGAGLFEIGSDLTAPVLGAVAPTEVTATTATLGWTTSEPASGQVYFRRAGQSTWQTSALDAGPAVQHAVTIEGLWPTTSYEFRVESADAADNTATSPPSGFVTLASSHTYLRFEAESGDLSGPISEGTGAGSFGNRWLEVDGGTPTGVVTDPAGTVDHGFFLPSDGTWHVWVRMFGASSQSDSWFERVDDGTFAQLSSPALGAWQWVAARTYTLDAGQHAFTLGGREALARVDRVLVTDDADFVPTEAPGDDVLPPSPVTGLAADPTSGEITLGWTQPVDPDAARLVVRFRTDGVSPTSPVDGTPLVDTVAPAAGPEDYVHTGLTNGATYSYSVFVIDAAGNASPAATVDAEPAADPPPQVGNLRRTDTL